MDTNNPNTFADIICKQLGLPAKGVAGTVELLDEGCTIPFISRYRKERTGGLDEVQIAAIADLKARLSEMAKRKETIVKAITDQGKMTPELSRRIADCWAAAELEDIYLPYKPKRRTRAQVAREQGLEPLAAIVMAQRERDIERVAARFAKGGVADAAAALKGAQDIIAEGVSEDERTRNAARADFRRGATIVSKAVKGKADTDEAAKYSDYFDYSEPLRRLPAHRLLAMRRGEEEGVLRIIIEADGSECGERVRRNYVAKGGGQCSALVAEAVDDAMKRLVFPSMETEFAAIAKEKADEEAIRVFAENLRQLLLAAPLGQKRVMAIDPGFRTGCKVACLDAQGNLLHHEAIFPHPPVGKRAEAAARVTAMAEQYGIEAIAIGNGTAGRETESFVKSLHFSRNVSRYMVSEDGASVYSASETAREEFPDKDVTVRGAVSIGRRLMDPLAELVKIDPKSIGVGQYQHDVNQAKLKKSLDQTVESCVNSVGVNINTASSHLLTYVSGLGPTLARNIVDYRTSHGPFASRSELKKGPRLGPAAYEQCAGFLRIPGAENPLDNTAVHPESYKIVERMAADAGCTVAELIASPEKRRAIDLRKYVGGKVGMPTLTDIMAELEKPGRDPRGHAEDFEFDPNVTSIDNLAEGMVLPGIVTNVTNFGAFVDIGVHNDGLVHISQLADHYVADATQAVRLHQHVMVRVVEVDRKRNRISLSMKGLGQQRK